MQLKQCCNRPGRFIHSRFLKVSLTSDMYGILIYDGVEPIDLGATFGVLSIAKRIAPDLEFAGVARSSGQVVCANGMKVEADHSYADAPNFDEARANAAGPAHASATA